jgi:dCMP deaminase
MDLKDEVYLNVAKEVARLSKDKNTKVGSVIVDKQGKVVSTGRNGTVAGFDDHVIPHSREEESLEFWENGNRTELISNKYNFMIHSEINNLLMVEDKSRLIDSTIYVTGLPCPKCALAIAQSKISRVVIPEEWSIKSLTDEDIKVTKYIFAHASIQLQVGNGIVNLTTLSPDAPQWGFQVKFNTKDDSKIS